MQETLQDHHTSTSIGDSPYATYYLLTTSILWAAAVVNLDLTHRLTDRTMAYGTEVSTKQSKIMTNSMNNTSADISMKSQKLEEVTGFKYLGATLCKDGTCSAEVHIRIASAVAAMARLNRIWWCNTISFESKFKLYKSLVTSILLYRL